MANILSSFWSYVTSTTKSQEAELQITNMQEPLIKNAKDSPDYIRHERDGRIYAIFVNLTELDTVVEVSEEEITKDPLENIRCKPLDLDNLSDGNFRLYRQTPTKFKQELKYVDEIKWLTKQNGYESILEASSAKAVKIRTNLIQSVEDLQDPEKFKAIQNLLHPSAKDRFIAIKNKTTEVAQKTFNFVSEKGRNPKETAIQGYTLAKNGLQTAAKHASSLPGKALEAIKHPVQFVKEHPYMSSTALAGIFASAAYYLAPYFPSLVEEEKTTMDHLITGFTVSFVDPIADYLKA